MKHFHFPELANSPLDFSKKKTYLWLWVQRPQTISILLCQATAQIFSITLY